VQAPLNREQSDVGQGAWDPPQKGQRLAQHDPPGAAKRRARTGNSRTHAQGEAAAPATQRTMKKLPQGR
jgi:hypothetical protein